MNWAKSFYSEQFRIGRQVHAETPGEPDADRVHTLGELTGMVGPLRILELGAGTGTTAAALADAGHTVVAIEFVEERAEVAQQLAATRERMSVVVDDFYEVDLDGSFDAVAYWDGFGVGDDGDQRRLLRRIADWLTPTGTALIDIYTPWYWAGVSGIEMSLGDAQRRYGFDADGCRMTDTWWSLNEPTEPVVQTLRCYSPADLCLLIANTGLSLTSVQPGGAMDYEKYEWRSRVSLTSAMSYTAKLQRSGD